MSIPVLLVPGYADSDASHWQSRWQARYGDSRVCMTDWFHPVREDWVATLDRALAPFGGDVIVVAHSLGCLTFAEWSARSGRQLAGALLVAPPDPGGATFPEAIVGFDPPPVRPIATPTVLVASRDDPYADFAFAQRMAAAWHATLVDIGARGHINGGSGLDDWPEGRVLLARFSPAGTGGA
ncbi:RBBP9/YdeN family alpha/beta hydrolase [Chitinasiproducens palmae]|uniref:Alpha/beta hydrolase n=1 Tax=Chitinasiproducens palmae TaxID=1770053 RepID=A0A1H2PN72_9BURK|nr:alpha/beta fold hydrolase [Chitinasiproducens palmae]SDV48078.1 hypothetical protein SAMN05216551_104141 [Chitinasiproducens palmae]